MSEIKKTYIGYDLGDGESICDCITLTLTQAKQATQEKFTDMMMPGMTMPGRAVPTVYGFNMQNKPVFASSITMMPNMVHDVHANFKRRPTDLIPGMNDMKRVELIEVFSKTEEWPDRADCNTTEMRAFREAVVTFTDAVFQNGAFETSVRGAASDSSEIVVNVGHPTRWDALDAKIYQRILKDSVIGKGTYAGKPITIGVAAESRAAYLAVRDKTTSAVLPKGTCALLVDTGSSTVDLTAVSANAHNYEYNSGSNYLGVRGIDFMIRELYLEKVRADSTQDRIYQMLVASNPSAEIGITVAARMAKEQLYTLSMGGAQVIFGTLMPVMIMQDEVEDLIRNKPLAPVLRKYSSVPEAELKRMGNKSWAQLFEEFLRKQKAAMSEGSTPIKVGRVIMTGSASRMPVVGEIIAKVFGIGKEKVSIIMDMDPSRSISKGLALVGVNEEKTRAFEADLQSVIKSKVPQIIADDVPQLVDALTPIIHKEVRGIVFNAAHDWKNGWLTTLNDMTDQIKQECSEQNLNAKLSANKDYTGAIANWCADVVGADIAVELKSVCDRYHVGNISVDSLNVLNVGKLDPNLKVDPGIGQMIADALATVAAVVGVFLFPTILSIVLSIIAFFSVELAWAIVLAIAALPVAGQVFLVGLFGFAVFKLIQSGAEGIKNMVTEKVQSADIPKPLRGVLTDNKLENELTKADLERKIRASLTSDETKQELSHKIAASLESQIEKRMEDIKYRIQSE